MKRPGAEPSIKVAELSGADNQANAPGKLSGNFSKTP
jgi:hypothetical protein